jgi:hypothetical protein
MLLLILLPFSLASAQEHPVKPKVSKHAMTADQVAVYRAALAEYAKGGDYVVKIANRTQPLEGWLSLMDRDCVESFDIALPSEPVVEMLDPTVLDPGMLPVDPEIEDQLFKQQGFQEDLFTFSEIVFDKPHQHAVVAYYFFCGWICGQGKTLVLERLGSTWRTIRTCSEGVS